MPAPRNLPDDLRRLLQGTPWGEVFPARPNPPPPGRDGRTVALRLLRRYVAALEFMRPGDVDLRGAQGAPIPFSVEEKDVHIGWPDYEVRGDNFPRVVFLHQLGNYDAIGFNSYVEEGTRDVYGKGTVVQWMSEYREEFTAELWASKKPELRALLAGLEAALSPTEQMYGLRFRMPEYFDQLVCFTVKNRQETEEVDAAIGRRHARLAIEMRFNVVALVNYVQLEPSTDLSVDADADTGGALDVDCGPADPPC